jgi:hypothetical protein
MEEGIREERIRESRMVLTVNRNEYLNSKPGRAEFGEDAE